jgi:hypothetical protein
MRFLLGFVFGLPSGVVIGFLVSLLLLRAGRVSEHVIVHVDGFNREHSRRILRSATEAARN